MKRLIILALLGLLFGAVAPAQESEPDTVQERHNEATEAYEVALADYESATAAYIESLKPLEVPVAVATPVAVPVQVAEDIEERMGFGLTYWNDGGCRTAGKALTGSYDREAPEYDIHGSVRTGPSGGDCERNATAFTVSIERRYAIGGGWSAVGKFLADRRSTSAPYAIVDSSGVVLSRPDGMASDPVTLPAGAATTPGGYLGISSPVWAGLRITIAGNVVPVEWADHDESLAGHVAISYDVGDTFDLDAHADIGRDHYGGARASWRPSVASRIGTEFTVGYSFGLNAVDGGEPARQTFAGLPVSIQGAPRDDAWTLGIGITF